MDLNENMGYVPDQSRRRLPGVTWVVLGVSAALIVFTFAFRLGGGEPAAPEPEPDPAASVPATPDAPSAELPPAESFTPAPSRPEGEASAEAWSTLMAFMDGWQSTSRSTRQAVFADTATDELAAGLVVTDTGKVITRPVEAVTVTTTGDTLVVFQVRFTGVDFPDTAVHLLAEPEAVSGWVVSDIGPVR